ncbi:MAG: hypothetical protein WB609_06125 [Candidatus Cybelea sp.]
MRNTVLLASGALAVGLMLAACSSGGNSSALPGALRQAQGDTLSAAHRAAGIHAVALKPAVRNTCPPSKFSFCVTISKSSDGPYWDWCGGPSCSGSQFDLVAIDSIAMTKSGRNMDRQLHSWFAPSPGNPTENYIHEQKVFAPGPHMMPKFTETANACFYYYPSECSTVVVGLIPGS